MRRCQGTNGQIYIAVSSNEDPGNTATTDTGVGTTDQLNVDNKSDATESNDHIQEPTELEEGEVFEEHLDELDEELLDVLGEEIPASNSQVKMNERLKKWWKGWMERGISEEVRKELLKKYPRDGELVTEAPKINLEVQRLLTEISKKRDEHFTKTQRCVGTAIASLGGAISLLTEPSSEPVDQTLLLKYLWDTGKILTDVFHQQSSARKSFITPALDKDLKTTLEASVSDEWLYGEKLSEHVKEAKAIVKAAATLKTPDKPATKRPSNRSFVSGNAKGLPVRPRQVGSYLPRRVRNVNYRSIAPLRTSRTSQGTSSERTQGPRRK